MKDTDLAYIAGFMDGEGSIMGVNRYRSSGTRSACPESLLSIRTAIAQNDIEVLQWMQELFGGVGHIKVVSQNDNYTCYSWELSGKSVGILLSALHPHLKRLKEKATAALMFCDTLEWSGGKPLTEEIKRLRQISWRRLKQCA